MTIESITELPLPEVKLLRFKRFDDPRGYFMEHFNAVDFGKLEFLKPFRIAQSNTSHSKPGTFRGFHSQWNPFNGKLVRVLNGSIIDMAMDIRPDSTTFGKTAALKMEAHKGEWIWIPPYFAHAMLSLEEATIEYLCTGAYEGSTQINLTPYDDHIDWSLCAPELRTIIQSTLSNSPHIKDEDKNGFTLKTWGKQDMAKDFRIAVNKTPGILVTGGSGLLGSHLKKHLPKAIFPSYKDFNICDPEQMRCFLEKHRTHTILHAAALANPPRCQEHPEEALETNIAGTLNITRLCMEKDIRLVYISSDYVFRGNKGNYKEDDELHPVNTYAWSKLGGECAVRMHQNSLIIRTTFGTPEFPHPAAFVDQWTSRESVEFVAPRVAKLALSARRGVIHVGGKRKTVMEYAQSLHPTRSFASRSRTEIGTPLPYDSSLNCEEMEAFLKKES